MEGDVEKPLAQIDIDFRSDADGRVVWEHAPEGELLFDIGASGYFGLHAYSVHADNQEHQITLKTALTISGTVRNAKTGNLIPAFRIACGRPVTNHLDGTVYPQWSSLDRFWPKFGGGEFHHTFEEGVFGDEPIAGFVLKFEADGYAPLISRRITADEGEVRLDVSLRPSTNTIITLLTPGGVPAANADVAFISRGGHVTMTKAGSFPPNNCSGCFFATTDANGTFQLPDDDSLIRVLMVHPEGFADTTPQQLTGQTTWQLQPWGRIEGSWISGGQPAAGRVLTLLAAEAYRDSLTFEASGFTAETDSEGRFHLDRVPPGARQLLHIRGGGWGHATAINVLPGETTSVTLGNSGHRVLARATLPEGVNAGLNSTIGGFLQKPEPEPVGGMVIRGLTTTRYVHYPINALFMTQSDGSLAADDVEPGNYELILFEQVSVGEGQATRTYRAPKSIITIPADPATGTIDLGVVTLQPAAIKP